MPRTPLTPTFVAIASGLVLVVAFVYPGLNVFYRLLTIPLWISFATVLCSGLLITAACRSDRHGTDSPRRHGLITLAFTTPSAWSAVLTRQAWEESTDGGRLPNLHRSASKQLNQRLDGIFALIRSSFILPWYTRISPSTSFPNAVEILIRQVLGDVVKRAETVDWSTVLVSRIIPIVTDHVHHFRAVEHLSSTSAAPSPNAALPLPLPANAHTALSEQSHVSSGAPLVEAHFRSTLGRVFDEALPETERSEVVRTIVKEVGIGAILMPCFDMICESDFWNRQIDEKGGRYLHEQKQVNKFLSALSTLQPKSKSGTISAKPSPVRSRTLPPASSITAASSTSQFESFMRSIPKLKTLGEARRLRADIEREQRLAKAALEKTTQEAEGNKDADGQLKRAKRYVKRLERARTEVDARILILSRPNGKTSAPLKTPENSLILSDPSVSIFNLYAVLSDPSSLAYWLEYMERRGRSRLVQFWLTIEGFKDPLEGIGQDSAAKGGTLISPNTAATAQNAQTVGEDLSFLNEMYFNTTDKMLNIPTRHVDAIRDLASNGEAILAVADVRQAKQAMFASQHAVYEQMEEEDWTGFKKSELFVKAVADLSKANGNKPDTGSPEIAYPTSPPRRPKLPDKQNTAPAATRALSDSRSPLSPTSRPLPILLGGQFTPASAVTPAASVSITPPTFERRRTEERPSMSRQHSGGDTMNASISSLPETPPTVPRRSSHLDFLIGAELLMESEQRDKLFGDEEEDGEILNEDDEDDFVQNQRMEAIQAALDDIIASDDLATSRVTSTLETVFQAQSSSTILPSKSESRRRENMVSKSAEDLRSIPIKRAATSAPHSRLPSTKVSPPMTHRSSMSELAKKDGKYLFDDDIIDECASVSEIDNEEEQEAIHTVLPGDLDLIVELARLQGKIEELIKQEHLLETLIRQAELTGSQSELRILRRSQSSVRREQRTAIFQKAQYEQQEEEHRLIPGRTLVSVPTAATAADIVDGKQVVRYTIEVKQTSEDGQPVTAWVVTRRYNDFWEVDRALREWTSSTGQSFLLHGVQELPPKKLVPNLSAPFIETRRQGLQRFLQSLVASGPLCETRVLRAFLSQSSITLTTPAGTISPTSAISSLAPHNLVKSLYKTMATSLDENMLGPNMLDLMYSTLGKQLTEFGGLVGIGGDELAGLGNAILPQALRPGWARDPSVSPALPSTIQPLGGESGVESFTAPICDLFIEIFDLKENNWLRRQAIVVILQQFLGGTIERKVRDSLRAALSAESLERTLASFQDVMWPDGQRRPPVEPRTETEKLDTKLSASLKLGLLIPDVAANMIGKSNARRAARRVFGALQDRRLNQHLMLCILDEIINALFPNAK